MEPLIRFGARVCFGTSDQGNGNPTCKAQRFVVVRILFGVGRSEVHKVAVGI